MQIDFHTHCFPDKIAERAVGKLYSICGITPQTNGTYDDTCRAMKEWGTDIAVLFNIATNAHQQTSVNNFAASHNNGPTRAFGSVHPEAENALEELERIKELGLRGIKLHPDYQEFFVEEERIFPIYQKCQDLGLMVAFHAGWDPLSPEVVHTTPKGMVTVLDHFPNLTVILAHMGGFNMWEDVEKYMIGRNNVYLDTSLAMGNMPKEQFVRMVRNHGVKRILFGTDCPWSDGAAAVEYVKASGLTEDEQALIFYKNGCELLGIPGENN
ncbi:MAG: amidohydrolase family protein [Candidatus Pararuminococcus gallinarum]|jgi:predicted TIM-barrel fold metal-dependent hydrolase